MPGEIRKAVIRRIAEERRIPLSAAAHRYACMPMSRKQELCAAEQRRPRLAADPAARAPTDPLAYEPQL